MLSSPDTSPVTIKLLPEFIFKGAFTFKSTIVASVFKVTSAPDNTATLSVEVGKAPFDQLVTSFQTLLVVALKIFILES